MSIYRRIKKIFTWAADSPRPDGQALQESFRKQYGTFKSLLTANNQALELMAELESTLQGGQPFGMTVIRSLCTALTVNVFKMTQLLQILAPGRYSQLTLPFTSISGQLEAILNAQPRVVGSDYVLSLAQIGRDDADQVGEKMANLGEVRNRLGLPVPEGFVITAAASTYFVAASQIQDEINRRLQMMDPDNLEDLYTVSAGIQQLISNADLPADLADQILDHYQRLTVAAGGEVLVAMRSSALGEDSGNLSFAGQYRTQLQVAPEFLHQIYKEIVASKYKGPAIVYRLQRGYRHQDVTMCVGCLQMVEAKVSGVLYSRSPQNLRSNWVEIFAVPGLATQVVDGSGATDWLRVERGKPNRLLAQKLCPNRRPDETLTPGQAQELALIAVCLEEHFGNPQDIEWSLAGSGTIYILQTRPLLANAGSERVELQTEEPDAGSDYLLSGGMCASTGVGGGVVQVVNSHLDYLSFPTGAVLVVPHPVPELASLLPRAAAVVSETGQFAAHLATVAREFGIPAIFGLAGATSTLTNGQEVTVDALACRIYGGRRTELLALALPPPNLMAGSPVYRILQQVMALVTPLHLTDPASPYFRASACQTLHDITRYCHEKAVAEMFAFGKRAGFDQKAAKQLVGDSPYTWWVINLDDGFTPGLNDQEPFIHLSDIISLPMLAIWQGMTTIPWPGPPPVSLRGFGSILFQSTMTPGLDPAVRSGMNNKSYFLISKNFCNLSVRLGYHFALIETHLGDFLTENYVSFQFKGGAADLKRRSLRVQLLQEILERFDFRVELRGDALLARIEKKPAPYLTIRLKLLGYLLIHTRQIDMVMGDQEMFDSYRQKIGADLELVLANPLPEGGEHDR